MSEDPISRQVAARRIAVDLLKKQIDKATSDVVRDALTTQLDGHLRAISELEMMVIVDEGAVSAASNKIAGEIKNKSRHPLAPHNRVTFNGDPPPPPKKHKKEDAVDWDRAMLDFDYFCRECLTITYRPGMNKDFIEGGYGPMVLTYGQKLVSTNIINELFVLKKPCRKQILKTRQLGNTTLLAALITWVSLKIDRYSSLIVIDRDEHGDDKRFLIQGWIESIKVRFPQAAGIASRAGKTLRLSNGSMITIDSAQSSNPGTSMMYKFVVYSEMPKWKTGADIKVTTSVSPGVPFAPYTAIINESTAYGRGLFYKLFMSAAHSKADVNQAIFLPWYISPEYRMDAPPDFSYSDDPEYGDIIETENGEEIISERAYALKYGLSNDQVMYRRSKIASTAGGRNKFDQEYPTTPDHAFRNASATFFKLTNRKIWNKAASVARRYEIKDGGTAVVDHRPAHHSQIFPVVNESDGGLLFMRRAPTSSKKYYAGLDVAEGRITEDENERIKEDWSVLTIKDDKGVTCAVYRSRKKPETAWLDVLLICKWYNSAFLQIERNSVGTAIIGMIVLTGYANLRAEKGPRAWRDRVGVHLSGGDKRKTLLEGLRQSYETSPSRAFCYTNDEETWQGQADNFVVVNGKPQSDTGCHDDIIMSAAHAEDCRRFYLGDRVCREAIGAPDAQPTNIVVEGSIADILGKVATQMFNFRSN